MRILYGVVGEGMGHATRSAVVLDHLLSSGHEVKVVVSGRAHDFLKTRFVGRQGFAVEEIHGITLKYFGNKVSRTGSLFWNLKKSPEGVKKNIKVYRKVAEEGFRPRLVISDFESWAALYGLNQRIPVISIDNIQAVNRLKHNREIRKGRGFDFRVARLAVKVKVPRAYHYLISSFFFPPVRKNYTTLVPPILRDEVLQAVREPGQHVVVYQRGIEEKELLPLLRRLPFEFRVYGSTKARKLNNVTLCPFSSEGFLDDLRTARAAIAGGGFSLLSEAVSLGVPLLAVPIEGQFEQELNARYLEQLGYGAWARRLGEKAISAFLEKTGDYEKSLAGYERHDNRMLFECLDELIERVGKDKKRPKRLDAKSMGSYQGR